MPAICRRCHPWRAWGGSVGCREPTLGERSCLLPCVRRRKASGVWSGGAPAHQFVSLMCAAAMAPALAGQRRFVWWRQAVEHSFNGPAGGYPSPLAKPAPAVGPPNGPLDFVARALWAEGWGVGASPRAGTGNRCLPASERASRLGRLPARHEPLAGTALTDPS